MRFGIHTISVWFGAIIILIVVAGAIAIAATDVMEERLYGSKRIFFVILLLAYAVYRVFRLRQSLKQINRDNE